ncbi:MAG: type III-A CRISPR-associated RAMP protein Csm5 [Bryobacteraceae bacterium]
MPEARFTAVPLSPVHIGTGEPVGPEEYYLEDAGAGKVLVRFSPTAVLGAAGEAERARVDKLLEGGKADEAVQALRGLARKIPEGVLYRCALGGPAAKFLQGWLTDPGRSRGEVRPMPHNPYDGRVVIPGSALKGALRTGVVSSLANTADRKAWREEFLERIEATGHERELSRLAGELEKELIRADGEMESDPFRFLKVEDASLAGKEVLRIDEARVVYADEDLRKPGPPMFVERLVSRADGGEAGFQVTVRIANPHEISAAARRNKFAWTADLQWILRAANSFFRHRYQAEAHRFPALYSALPAPGKLPEGFLLRVGRYSHFESLSVEGLRKGFNRQKRTWIREGSTRTVCELAGGKRAPFGWILLRAAS